jgi:hypothetical protein
MTQGSKPFYYLRGGLTVSRYSLPFFSPDGNENPAVLKINFLNKRATMEAL